MKRSFDFRFGDKLTSAKFLSARRQLTAAKFYRRGDKFTSAKFLSARRQAHGFKLPHG
ncbi:MAG: hypothetical protein SR1Q7_03090 [Quinella sp. 1Q7]|nr:hypothetical protein [Quinella sp. 1Q7]